MKGLATILRETTIPKIEGDLIRYQEGVLEGKCARGVISCEVGLKLDEAHRHYSADEILIAAGLTQEQIDEDFPFMKGNDCSHQDGTLYESKSSLAYIIFHYNDTLEFSFKEIADFIETTFPEEDWAK